MSDGAVGPHDSVALVELVNRVVDRGVVLNGELTISVANVDLLFLGVRLLLCSADRVDRVLGPDSRELRLPREGVS